MNSKKETNVRVKMSHQSKWVKGQEGMLFFTSWKSRTNSEQPERNKWMGQNGPKVKMRRCCLPLKESNWQWTAKQKQMIGSKEAKRQNGPKVKVDYCCLPPERVKLTVNSKKETNVKVKMSQESRWAAVAEIGY